MMTRTTAKLSILLLAGGIAVAAAAQDKPVIGIAMPNDKAQELWVADGIELIGSLWKRGYRSDLRNARDDVATQIAQIESMVASGDKVLVIAPINSTALTDVLDRAAARGVKVIAYDRLIRGTQAVDYFASFDNVEAGILQARSLLRGLAMPPATGPFNIELFAGSPDDDNSSLYYDGAMSVLKPLIDDGRLVVRSGQATLEQVSTLRWNADAAHARLDNLLAAFYVGRHLDAVLSPDDELSSGIIASLQSAGYGSGSTRMAIVSGQDCTLGAVRLIMAGWQYASIFKDTRRLAEITAEMVDAEATGRPVPVNRRTGVDNGVKQVPTELLPPVPVYRDNIENLLIGSGFYTRQQID